MDHRFGQICKQCRNKRTGGRPIAAELGTFQRISGRWKDFKWVCHICQPKGVAQIKASRHKQSWLERQIAPVLAASAYKFEPQYELDKLRFDFCIPQLLLIIEADGRASHSTPAKIAHDRKKTLVAESYGWAVVRIPNGPDIEGRVQAALAYRFEQLYDKAMQAGEAPAP